MNDNTKDLEEYETLLRQGTANQGLGRVLEQQKRQAEHLRKQGAPQEGQMVSGHYIPPAWTQQLAGLGANIGAGMMDKRMMGTGQQMDSNQAMQNAAVLRMLMNKQPQQVQPPQGPPMGMEPPPGPPIGGF